MNAASGLTKTVDLISLCWVMKVHLSWILDVLQAALSSMHSLKLKEEFHCLALKLNKVNCSKHNNLLMG